MYFIKSLILFFFTTGLSFSAFSQRSSPDSLIAHRTEEKIILDGVLSEEGWSRAIPITNFTQREQHEGAIPTEQTKVAVLYNTHEIYFGIWCYDSDSKKISAQEMARDFEYSSDDMVGVMISPFNDNRNGFLFITNPNGAMTDVWLGEGGRDYNINWNGIWDVKVTRDINGWYAEIVIPFSTLKFKGSGIQTWGVNFERNVRHKKEQMLWQGWSRLYGIEKISQSGSLTGLKEIKQKERLEINPYIIGSVENGAEDVKAFAKIGGEVNFDITPTMKLNLTINTDFAQAESDRRQVNLSRFSIFYPEKRQFFLEGKNYFEMSVAGASMFYSRRIGIENDSEIPVLGGLRLFGKINKTSIGLMSLQTDGLGDIKSSNSTVIRVKQDIFDQSSIGFITTQKYSKDGYNAVYGADFTFSTSKLFGNKNLLMGASGAISVEGKNNLPVEQAGKNLTYHVYLYYPNDVWKFYTGINSTQENFNPGLGFSQRSDYKGFYGKLEYDPRFKNMPSYIRNYTFKPLDFVCYLNDKSGETETVVMMWRPLGIVFKSGEAFGFNVQHLLDKPKESFAIIDSISIPAGSYFANSLSAEFKTYEGRRISGILKVSAGQFYTGKKQTLEMYLNCNVNKHLNLGFDWKKNNLLLPQGDFRVNEFGGKIDYSFNPKLHANIFTQWNSMEREILLNYRISWMPKIGSFFYFVINQNINTNENRFKLTKTSILVKLLWRFAV